MRAITQHLSLSVLVPVLILIGSVIHSAVQRVRPPEKTPAETTRVTVLDVGQGDAMLIDGPDDAEILVDGGPMPDLVRQLARLLGDDRTIDLVVLTHPHADHLVGLVPVFAQYDIGRILITGVIHTTVEYERFLETVHHRNIPTTIAVAGQTYDVGPAHLEILYPFEDFSGKRVDNLNSSSIVAMLTIGMQNAECKMQNADCQTQRILLTGDAESDVETALLGRYCTERAPGASAGCTTLRADVLKVPHHGSQDSSSSALLTAVQSQHAIISVGKKNDYGHPHRRALKRLERIGTRIWRTDQDGDVTVTVAPDGLSVSSER